MKLIFLTGPQGSGKGTQAKKIIQQTGYNYFEMGLILRNWAASNAADPIAMGLKKGRLAPDNFVNNIFKESVIDPGIDTVVDGFPRTLPQANYILKFKRKIDPVFLKITAPDGILIQRLLARGRNDDTPEAIQVRD